MKFLEAQEQDGKEEKKSILPENKMQKGSRLDQKDPESLISSPHQAPADKNKKVDVAALAHQKGVKLDEVKGTGPDGQVTEQDVHTAARTAKQNNNAQ
jgi:pyruvate/2-oxoglutarate dehydrogenase complex dihydrolipoamide acyltransferase (E2) component